MLIAMCFQTYKLQVMPQVKLRYFSGRAQNTSVRSAQAHTMAITNLSYGKDKLYVMKTEPHDKHIILLLFNMIPKLSGGDSMPHLIMAETYAQQTGKYTAP